MSGMKKKNNPFKKVDDFNGFNIKKHDRNRIHLGYIFDDDILLDLGIENQMWVFIECGPS